MFRSLILRCSHSPTTTAVTSTLSKSQHRRANLKVGRRKFLDDFLSKDTKGQYEMLVKKKENKCFLKYADFKSLILGCKSSDDIDYAIKSLELYQKSFIEIHGEGANLFTKKCVEVNAPEKALQVLKGPYRVHTFATIRTFKYVIEAFAKSGNVTEAIESFDRMQELDIPISADIMECLIRLCMETKLLENTYEYLQLATQKKLISTELFQSTVEFLKSSGYEANWEELEQSMNST